MGYEFYRTINFFNARHSKPTDKTPKKNNNNTKPSITMKTTRANVKERVSQIKSIPAEFGGDINLVVDMTSNFSEWEEIDNDPDMLEYEKYLFDTIDELHGKQVAEKPKLAPAPKVPAAPKPKPPPAPKAAAKPKKKVQPKIKAVKPKRKRIKDMGRPVETVDIQVRFIKRYVLLDGKYSTREKIRAFISTMQRAIRSHQVRKTSRYADHIMHIQRELIQIWEDNQDNASPFKITFDASDAKVKETYLKIGYSQRSMKQIALVRRFLSIQGKRNVKERAKKLHEQVDAQLKKTDQRGKYSNELRQVRQSLHFYLSGKDPAPVITRQKLNGLNGIVGGAEKKNGLDGCGCDPAPSGGVIGVGDLHKAEFTTVGYRGKWLQLIGDPVEPYSMMIWSKPGKGKSSLMIEFSQYLASTFGKRVLFVAKEEGIGYTLKEKFVRMGATHPGIDISPENLPQDLTIYDYVIVDSVTAFGYNPTVLERLKDQNPTVSFVWIFQSTKDGNFRGSKDFEHLVDVSIIVNELGFARAEKSRFGGIETIRAFPEATADKIYKFFGLAEAEKYQGAHNPTWWVMRGDDGKVWVVDPEKGSELSQQGFQRI